ncbi:hypothetical protein Tco_1211059 [Tanacetum coccineum]
MPKKCKNPLALVAAAQQYPAPYYQAPKYHKSHAPPSKQSSSTRSHAFTRYKGKEIAKPITPLSSHSFFDEDKIQDKLKETQTDTEPLEKVQYDAEYNVFANER